VTKHSQKENDIRFYFVGHNDVGIVVEKCSYTNQNTFWSLYYSYNTYLQVHNWRCFSSNVALGEPTIMLTPQ